MIYGTFLFLAFQSCTQFAPIFENHTPLAPFFLQFTNIKKIYCYSTVIDFLSN